MNLRFNVVRKWTHICHSTPLWIFTESKVECFARRQCENSAAIGDCYWYCTRHGRLIETNHWVPPERLSVFSVLCFVSSVYNFIKRIPHARFNDTTINRWVYSCVHVQSSNATDFVRSERNTLSYNVYDVRHELCPLFHSISSFWFPCVCVWLEWNKRFKANIKFNFDSCQFEFWD